MHDITQASTAMQSSAFGIFQKVNLKTFVMIPYKILCRN